MDGVGFLQQKWVWKMMVFLWKPGGLLYYIFCKKKLANYVLFMESFCSFLLSGIYQIDLDLLKLH